MSARVSKAKRELVVSLRREGVSIRNIERHLGINYYTMYCWLSRNHPDLLPKSRTASPDQRSLARKRRAEGATLAMIAEELGFSTVAVWQWVKDIVPPKMARAKPFYCAERDGFNRASQGEISARIKEIPEDTRDTTGFILGDPVFERSALAMKDRRHEDCGPSRVSRISHS